MRSTCATSRGHVRDRIDRKYAQPLDVEALAYGESPHAYLITRRLERATAEMPSCVAKKVTRPIRNREAPAPKPRLA